MLLLNRRIHAYAKSRLDIMGQSFEQDSMTNVTASIISKVGMNLHLKKNHPLEIVKSKIEQYFDKRGDMNFGIFSNISPVVSVKQNFDLLGFPKDHVGRSRNDSYFINNEFLLRTHTTANENEIFLKGFDGFVLTGDVYRRDEIDSHHYPVFHQVEVVRSFPLANLPPKNNQNLDLPLEIQQGHDKEAVLLVLSDLQREIEGLVAHLFGNSCPIRWIPAFFPFTLPSLELEIFFNGKWIEVLGCGILQDDFMKLSKKDNSIAWACGLGLERLAMILFSIPDIRLFWSQDQRFLSQFSDGKIKEFVPFSKYPPVLRDVSFWINSSFSLNCLADLVRSIGGDLIEKMEQIDEFTHPTTKRKSLCFRITYRSMERSLTDEIVNEIHFKIRDAMQKQLDLELR